MKAELPHKIDAHRRLCIQKDLIELNLWTEAFENIHVELNHLGTIQKQLLRIGSIEMSIIGLRRKNTLLMGAFCKYEQELKRELEYGDREYDTKRAMIHEKERNQYANLYKEFSQLKTIIYTNLSKLQRR
ncbi:hypothetical protein IMCC3317_47130 [Kordia antarctica]|uniref:Uncharacterized protein n=1 Tax=Kordia antarctica TaxID=1218801 RepID=A0A7L4ZRG6_9FLAO|nr:hypothetical protein [Kordia antarctica]QHI39303.1 hypothetical protein IMCC3317_47130 [Kordia antarctica]